MVIKSFVVLVIGLLMAFPALAQKYDPTTGQQIVQCPDCPGGGGGGSSIVVSPVTTYSGHMTLTAATSTSLIAANVTMEPNSAALPAAGAFGRLVIISPGSACNFTVNWLGGTATATSGEQFGSGTNVGSDTVNLTGNANAPTLFSTAGCASPNVVQFHN